MTSVDTTIIKRLDKIFSAAPNYEQGAAKMFAEFVVIPRAELPEKPSYDISVYKNAAPFWHEARRNITIALAIEGRESEQAAAEAKRNARRDELAVELAEGLKSYGEHRVYEGLSTVARRAIDRIIELEEAAR